MLMLPLFFSVSDFSSLFQVLPLSILRMSGMLKMLSRTSTISHLVMTGAGYLWSGLRYNLVFYL